MSFSDTVDVSVDQFITIRESVRATIKMDKACVNGNVGSASNDISEPHEGELRNDTSNDTAHDSPPVDGILWS